MGISEIADVLMNAVITGLAFYGLYVAWELHKAIKRANRELDKMKEETDE